MKKSYKWVVEFEIDPIWVADGFNLDEERALQMLSHDLEYAYSCELGAKILKAPDAGRIRREQGYDD